MATDARATRSGSSTSTTPTATSGSSPGSSGSSGRRSTSSRDVVAFVNGLPLAVVECKSPTIGDAWKAEAVKQLHRYQEAGTRWKDQGAPKLFEAAQVLVGTCGEGAVYGTVGTPERFFLEWKEPYPLSAVQLGQKLGRAPTPQDILLYGLLEPRNLLDIVRNFVVFEVEDGRAVRKLTRYKQFIAVNEAMRRIRTARNRARGAASSGTPRGRARA